MAAALFEAIGLRVRSERERAELSQDMLAEIVGVKREAISRLERGQNATISFLARVSYALEIELAMLVEGVALTKEGIQELEATSKDRRSGSS